MTLSPRRMPAERKTLATRLLRRLMSRKVKMRSSPSPLHQTMARLPGSFRAAASTTS